MEGTISPLPQQIQTGSDSMRDGMPVTVIMNSWEIKSEQSFP